MSQFRFTILGCGSSPGVPRVIGDWGACDPSNPKNTRLRCSLLVELFGPDDKTTIVVDTSPDFRAQMLSANVTRLDGVLYTHPHADHVHGIDDVRPYVLAQRHRINVYADAPTKERLTEGFGYCFNQVEGSIYPAILRMNDITAGNPFFVDGPGGKIHVLPILQIHGSIPSIGFRFSADEDFSSDGLCYSSDVSDIPPASFQYFDNLDYWIVDALQYREHFSHFSVSESIEWSKRFRPKQTIFTHMHVPLDYETLKSELPNNIAPAYDGMVIEL